MGATCLDNPAVWPRWEGSRGLHSVHLTWQPWLGPRSVSSGTPCMCTYVCVNVYACAYVHAHSYMHASAPVSIYCVCACTCLYMFLYTCVCLCVSASCVYVSARMYERAHVCACIGVHVCVQVSWECVLCMCVHVCPHVCDYVYVYACL